MGLHTQERSQAREYLEVLGYMLFHHRLGDPHALVSCNETPCIPIQIRIGMAWHACEGPFAYRSLEVCALV
jgi:hypothetical protein